MWEAVACSSELCWSALSLSMAACSSWAVSINSLTELSLRMVACEVSIYSLTELSLRMVACEVSIYSLTELSLRMVACEASIYSLTELSSCMVACEVSELSLRAAACSWAVSMYSFSTAVFSCLSSPPFSKATLS